MEKRFFVGPYPDDVELGCGGIIAKYRDEVEMYKGLEPLKLARMFRSEKTF